MSNVSEGVLARDVVKQVVEDTREINQDLDIKEDMEEKVDSFQCIENYLLVGFLI
jgi:uncharacterized protein YuzE